MSIVEGKKWRYWQILFVTLLAAWMVCGIVSAALISVASATSIPIFTNSTHESPVGNITNATLTRNIISVSWENTPALEESDQAGIINLYCSDSWQPYWGGMAYGSGGMWDFSLYDIRRLDVNGCWFDIINGASWGME